MSLDTSRPPRKRLSMTSLIDVIFLLLLFFMLSSTFSRFGEIELSSATQSGTGSAEQPMFLNVESVLLRLNGSHVKLADLAANLDRQENRRLLVSLSDGVASQRLINVLAVLHDVDGLSVTVLQ